MLFLESARAYYKEWRDRRFLKKHHCDNCEQYHRRFDPDVAYAASMIRNYYHGYPYIFVFNNNVDDPLKGYGDWMQGLATITQWAKLHCKYKFRHDFHRVIYNNWTNEWEMNELGGGDYLFFAFKDEVDHFHFSLRWG